MADSRRSGYALKERTALALFIEGMTNLKTETLIKEFEKDLSDVLKEEKSVQTMTPIVKKVLRKQALEWIRAEGKIEEKHETARLMLADAMPTDLISKFTGLTLEEIEALRT